MSNKKGSFKLVKTGEKIKVPGDTLIGYKRINLKKNINHNKGRNIDNVKTVPSNRTVAKVARPVKVKRAKFKMNKRGVISMIRSKC